MPMISKCSALTQTGICASLRANGPCCSKITLNEIKHSPQFTYLSSVISELGGNAAETATGVGKATTTLNRTSKIWASPASIRTKCRLLNSRNLPVLEYTMEWGNHMQADLKLIDRFVNTSRQ